MTTKFDLAISLDSSNTIALLHAISEFKPFRESPPTIVSDGFNEYKENLDNWINTLILQDESNITAYWGKKLGKNNKGFISIVHGNERRPDMVKFKISNSEFEPKAILNMLAPLPWTLAEFTKIHRNWLNSDGTKYIGNSFGGLHFAHGWACAFKGKGHNRLVSRRWLEFNPWHLIRDEENDISFVQFHELDADPATALLQAQPGHERMGISDIGGFIKSQEYYTYQHEIRGVYVPEQKKLDVVVIEREVSQREMLDFCAAKQYQILPKDQPLERVAYVFLKQEESIPYLQELWLRGLECWVYTPQGILTRIDEDYQPDYEHPSWVRGLKLQQQQIQIEEKKQQLAKVEKKIANLEGRIKNASGGKLTGSLNQNDALTSLRKQLQKELRKQRVVQQKLEREIAQLENNQN